MTICKYFRREFWFCLVFLVLSNNAFAVELTRKQALIIAESTKEAELLYKLYDGRLENCIDKEVVKPCDSGWVTCIESAWVVQFTLSDICNIKHDGRLGLTILIDSITGRIISRYPEAQYFESETYCMDNSDCVCEPVDPHNPVCGNFIFAQVKGDADLMCTMCECSANRCVLKGK
ncbi:MAG: hypothetical protein KBD53_07795 [Candidatus Omnitrophica bacterium]|nr:hypothetical protein [Candidatus Omnitrophota bacterium]